ncbi:6-carboxytetrahydropterin synthase [Methanofollis formosanus]|uniref:6-carboxytetrahydropterin synthase n=1 Tax=Methanofollis formosanus TaxID=299308 RepID=A0A8G1A2J3_9EURY|nr:6-carboxytetrahydropterin synthase [Methanofollis formosanus]QYZ79194.1 6-carboxytetrahydropterin synthase [Methanofollis formosanus]
MVTCIYKVTHFDASHRLLHYQGKCNRLHGHRWQVEVWVKGTPDPQTGILIDFNTMKDVVDRFDHQVVLNEDDPMVECLGHFQEVVTTRGDPTSEVLAEVIAALINEACADEGSDAKVTKIRVWEAETCYAEIEYAGL